jgi:hypothetical protein
MLAVSLTGFDPNQTFSLRSMIDHDCNQGGNIGNLPRAGPDMRGRHTNTRPEPLPIYGRVTGIKWSDPGKSL